MEAQEKNTHAEELQKTPGNTAPGDAEEGQYLMTGNGQPLVTEDGRQLSTEHDEDSALESGAKVDQ